MSGTHKHGHRSRSGRWFNHYHRHGAGHHRQGGGRSYATRGGAPRTTRSRVPRSREPEQQDLLMETLRGLLGEYLEEAVVGLGGAALAYGAGKVKKRYFDRRRPAARFGRRGRTYGGAALVNDPRRYY